MRKRSTPRAALRPSAIAQTIRDWPRCMSPAVKTPGTLVIQRRVALDVAAVGELDAELLEQARPLGPDEAHGQQDELARQRRTASPGPREHEPAVLAHQLDPRDLQRLDPAALVADEAAGGDRVDPLAALLVGRGDAEDVRPLRPRVVRRALVGRARDDLELVDARRALAVGGAQAVGAGVAAADDDHVLALRR